ncbi:MAG: GNAT family N-acetyltransferase [Deltaproteobacteria bacterium]|nr:GNAT family N-acetyltransferase [Nannocystaceae bacterium]
MSALHFDASWSEDVVLSDGSCVRLRPVRPDDKEAIAGGLARLSPESQYLRFFTSKPRLTDSELRYLTEVDGIEHFAIVCALLEQGGTEGRGVGVARFVRSPEDPEVAEPAVVVVDELQGKGLGRVLMERLIQAAAERGVQRFRSEFLAVNTPMKELLATLSPAAQFTPEGSLVVAEFPLHEPTAPATMTKWPIYEWLRLTAARAVEIRRSFGMLFDHDTVLGFLQRVRREIAGDSDEPPKS